MAARQRVHRERFVRREAIGLGDHEVLGGNRKSHVID
jgi:hypothetical protein